MTQRELPIPTPNGFDSVVARRNPEWAEFLPINTEVMLIGNRGAAVFNEDDSDLTPTQLIKASIVLRQLVRRAVELGGLPDRVQTAWFVVTTDPAVVKMYGEAHDCATCRAGTDQALARLREYPWDPLVVGILAF